MKPIAKFLWVVRERPIQYVITFICCVIFLSACTQNHMMPASSVQNYQNTMEALKTKTTLPVVFPQKIPKCDGYASYTLSDDGYSINIDNTADCHGAHYCNIGMLRAEKSKKPEIQYDRDNQKITRVINLQNGQSAYYTPAHAMADYWPTMIQWQINDVRYTLTWQLPAKTEQTTILTMANVTPRR